MILCYEEVGLINNASRDIFITSLKGQKEIYYKVSMGCGLLRKCLYLRLIDAHLKVQVLFLVNNSGSKNLNINSDDILSIKD